MLRQCMCSIFYQANCVVITNCRKFLVFLLIILKLLFNISETPLVSYFIPSYISERNVYVGDVGTTDGFSEYLG